MCEKKDTTEVVLSISGSMSNMSMTSKEAMIASLT